MTVSVLVPSSVVREAEDKREATRKLGYIARAATVFRADRLTVFPDREGEEKWGGDFVDVVLRYAVTPPYLRKEAFGRRDELQYAGILPPLRVASRTGSESNGSGPLRQGIVTEVGPEGRVRVNCGLQHPISLIVPSGMTVDEGERVTIRISSRSPVRAKIVDEPPPGFTVERMDLSAALRRDDAGLTIATSRFGERLTVGRLGRLVERIQADGATVAFGSPGRGLADILDIPVPEGTGARRAERDGVETEAVPESDSGTDRHERERDGPAGDDSPAVEPGAPGWFDLWLNAIPNQGSETVRTEEAMFAALGCLTLEE